MIVVATVVCMRCRWGWERNLRRPSDGKPIRCPLCHHTDKTEVRGRRQAVPIR